MSILTRENTHRYTIFPIKYPDIWEMFQTHRKMFWVESEVDLSNDLSHWKKLSADEQHFIKHILAFFAGSDGIVLENLALRFFKDVQIPEARAFYSFQMTMETIHGIMYSQLIDAYIENDDEKQHLFRAIETIPCIKQKALWAQKYIESDANFATRLIAFAVVEGIFFSGAFCSIFWLQEKGILPGLCLSNRFISLDESLHCVVPETMLLTSKGYKKIVDCVGEKTSVWNGYEWSDVYPVQTGIAKKIYKVILDNGVEVECTSHHKWVVVSDDTKNTPNAYKFVKKDTEDLKPDDILSKFKLPVLDPEDPTVIDCAYTQGFFAGKGYYEDELPMVCLQASHRDIHTDLAYIHYTDQGRNLVVTLNPQQLKSKEFVPFNYSLNTKLRWLEGYMDASLSAHVRNLVIRLTSESFDFLRDVQLLLTTLGCQSRIINGSCLEIKTLAIAKLYDLGFDTMYVNVGCALEISTRYKTYPFIRVVEVEDEDRVSDTFCFTEPKNHTAVFNGVMTGQCDFAVLLYTKYMDTKLPFETVKAIISEAVEIEESFIVDSLPCSLLGMNSNLMREYIQYVANRLSLQLGYPKIYANAKQPFPFVGRNELDAKANFFEGRVSSYQMSIEQHKEGNTMDDLDFHADF
jgi:ribonucleotide reductase beta subunit family protein with ferritin-like domain